MRVVTYNVHDCIGRDGRHDPRRVAGVITELQADVVALQEVTLDPAGELVGILESLTSLSAVDGSLFERGVGRYGNLVMVREPVAQWRLHDLSRPGREPRGAVELDLVEAGLPIRVLGTHLGLARGERRWQIRRLAELVAGAAGPCIVLGDFNVWQARLELGPLFGVGLSHRPVRSFPTWPFAALSLDQVLVSTPLVVERCWRHATPLSRRASDHFPVAAELAVGA